MDSITTTLIEENQNIDILDILDTNELTQNYDILEEITDISKEDKKDDILAIDLFENYQNSMETVANGETMKESGKIKDFFKFIASYLTTSVSIFILLIVATNYSAYFQIAKSYINSDDGSKMSASLETKLEDPEVVELNSAKKAEESENKNYHSMTKLIYEANNEKIGVDIDITPYENRIIIPKIGKNIPLVNVENKQVINVKELEDVFMKELEKWVVRYPGSWVPGENGNMFVFGHSSNFPWIKWDYNDIFATLDKVVFNDEIIIYYNQKKYTYIIREKKVIKPGEVSILKRDLWKSEVTLMTCYPIWTSINRLVVIWELVPNK